MNSFVRICGVMGRLAVWQTVNMTTTEVIASGLVVMFHQPTFKIAVAADDLGVSIFLRQQVSIL